jgi:hypothetical protein
MIFKRMLAGYMLLLSGSSVFAQTDSISDSYRVSSNFSIACLSSLIYPGVRAGIEFPLYRFEIARNNNQIAKGRIIKERFVSLNTGWYHHKNFHDNLFITAGWLMRRTKKSGFFTEFRPGLGYSRTFLGGTTYRADSNGDVKIVKLAGYNYALLTAGGGAGFDFSCKNGIPLSAFWDFGILIMFPYNSTIYFRPEMELGVIWKPENFLKLHVKNRSRQK